MDKSHEAQSKMYSLRLGLQGPTGWSLRALAALLQALVPALLMNICIVGLNQVYDVRIDRVNKPYLPLASGEFTMQTGIALVCRFTHCRHAASLHAMYMPETRIPLNMYGLTHIRHTSHAAQSPDLCCF